MAITIKVEPGYILVLTNQTALSEEEAKACVDALKEQHDPRPLVVFEFSSIKEVTLGGLRVLTRAASSISQQESRIAVIANKDVDKFIRDQGLNRLFPCHQKLSDVVGGQAGSSGAAGREQTLEFLNTVLEAITYTFQVSTNTAAKPGKSFVRTPTSQMLRVDIGASVGIFSAPFKGTLTLGFPLATYLGVMSRMLGVEYKSLDPEIQDGSAELLNIILGQAKTQLNEKGYAIKQAIPTVVRGSNIEIAHAAQPSVIVPFSSDVGDFYVELSTRPQQAS